MINIPTNTPNSAVTDIRHFLDLDVLDRETLSALLVRADEMKAEPHRPILRGRTLAMVFEKPSTRTRVSFEVGMTQLGGHAVVLTASDMQLGRGETIEDTARVLSRYVSAIMLRTGSEDNLLQLAEYSSVPVINGLTNRSHPCQILADLMTVRERLGRLNGLTMAWVGDFNNVARSFLHAAAAFEFTLTVAAPEGFTASDADIAWAEDHGAQLRVSDDPRAAVGGADVVITDTWVSMGDADAAARRQRLAPYQVTADLMALARNNAVFLHCLPAHRGEEVTAEVIDGPQSAVWDEAENRLHVQKAVLAWCMHA